MQDLSTLSTPHFMLRNILGSGEAKGGVSLGSKDEKTFLEHLSCSIISVRPDLASRKESSADPALFRLTKAG